MHLNLGGGEVEEKKEEEEEEGSLSAAEFHHSWQPLLGYHGNALQCSLLLFCTPPSLLSLSLSLPYSIPSLLLVGFLLALLRRCSGTFIGIILSLQCRRTELALRSEISVRRVLLFLCSLFCLLPNSRDL